MKLVFGGRGDRARGHLAEVDVFAQHLDFSVPHPPTDHCQAAQQHKNSREHADGDEDDDGVRRTLVYVSAGAVQCAWRPLQGRRRRRSMVSVPRGVVLPKNRHTIEGFDVAAAPTLAELVAGMARGRVSPEQKTVFVNLPGLGLQFAAVGAALYQKARAAGHGHELPTEWFTEDVVP